MVSKWILLNFNFTNFQFAINMNYFFKWLLFDHFNAVDRYKFWVWYAYAA